MCVEETGQWALFMMHDTNKIYAVDIASLNQIVGAAFYSFISQIPRVKTRRNFFDNHA